MTKRASEGRATKPKVLHERLKEVLYPPLSTAKKLVEAGMRPLGYGIERLHGIEQAGWISELGIVTVLDIGANVGQFAGSIRKVLPDAQIYAFEPVEECFAALSRNVCEDVLVRCFPYALGSEDGSTKFNKNDYSQSSSLLPLADAHIVEFPHTAKVSKTEVEVRRLDSIAPTLDLAEPLLVKMDVQGFELHVIKGGRETLARADVVITEVAFVELYEGQPSFHDLHKEFSKLGLTFCGVIEQMYSSRNDLPLYCDALFVRTDTL